MVFVGVAAQLLSIDLSVVEAGLKSNSRKAEKSSTSTSVREGGLRICQQKLVKQDPYVIER